MGDIKWNKPFNFYDIMTRAYREQGVRMNQTPRQYYGEMVGNIAARAKGQQGLVGDSVVVPIRQSAATGAVEGLAELVWYEFGRPVWFIDNTMLELLLTAHIDDDLTGVHFPHESVLLCFEEGAKVAGLDLRSILLFVPRSELIPKIAREATGTEYFGLEFLGKLVGTWTDCLPGPDYKFTPPAYIQSRDRIYNWRKYTEPTDVLFENLTDQERAVITASMQIAAAAMLYYAARPELVSQYQLPRSQRYEFRGERSGFRRMVLPGVKHVAGTSAKSMGTGSPKSPHYRGWVLRVLRDARYKRKPDGTFQTVLVPPTAIHPEMMGERP